MCGCVALFGLFGRAIFVKPSRQPQEKNSVNQLFFLLSKAPLFTPSAGRGGWYPILGHLGICFLDPPPRGEGVPHIAKNPYTAAWGERGGLTLPQQHPWASLQHCKEGQSRLWYKDAWMCGGTGRCLAFLVERFSSNQAVSHKKKNT